MTLTPLQKLARRLKVKKDGLDLLKQALTHKSFLGDAGQDGSYERMEFLGDSVLGMVVAAIIAVWMGGTLGCAQSLRFA